MSSVDETELANLAFGLDPAGKRDILNPFDDGPTSLFDAANELCRNYMQRERDAYTVLGKHHAEWLRLLNERRKLVLNCHRDGLKTTTVLCYLALRLEYDPGFQAIWVMNNQSMAGEKAHSEFNKFVERNPWLTSLQKVDRRRDTIQKKEFENGSTLRAAYLDGGIDGERAHFLILDDLIKARGDGSIEAVREWVEGTALPMVKDNGRTVFVGTRKRRDDLYQHYRSLDAYSVAEYPAILDVWEQANATAHDADARRPPSEHYTEVETPNGPRRILWPEARGFDWLDEKRAEMADYRFFREYCLSFIGGSGDLIQPADVNRLAENGGCSIRGETPPRQRQAGQGERIIVGHDPAQSPTGDLAAFTVWLFGRDGRRTMLDGTAGQGIPPSEIKATLADYNTRYDPAVISIEDNGIQQYVTNDALEMSPAMRSKVKGFSTSGRKHSWENGIPQLRNLVESGSIQFYRGHGATEDFITAAQSLELRDGKLIGHTPDYVASWYVAEKAQRELETNNHRTRRRTGGSDGRRTITRTRPGIGGSN